jgi:HlyD family secretion protein
VDNPDLSLRPGMTATILFEVAKVDDVLFVPNAALRFDPEASKEQSGDWSKPGRGRALQPRVFKLVGGQPVEVAVELGLNDGSRTAIVSGELKEGDQIITEQSGAAATPMARGVQQRMPRM